MRSQEATVPERPRILASTTSHKREPLLPTLEVFACLGLRDIDLNLHHILEEGISVDVVAQAAKAFGLRIWGLAGGWCDFYHPMPEIEKTFASVARQVVVARTLGAAQIRLFFGRLRYEEYSQARLEIITENLLRLSDVYPNILFVLENHDGASLHYEICRAVLEKVGRLNIRMNFDPINFEHAGVDSMMALQHLRQLIGHVHLKGLEYGDFCEFGEGDIDLTPLLRSLISQGYQGGFTVEYEGRNDGTVRLYRSMLRARSVIAELADRARGLGK